MAISAIGKATRLNSPIHQTHPCHVKGSNNQEADALSRITIANVVLPEGTIDYEEVAAEQQSDATLPPLFQEDCNLLLCVPLPSGITIICDISTDCPHPYIPLPTVDDSSRLTIIMALGLYNI